MLERSIRTIPDFPRPGILFRDITTLLGDPDAFNRAVRDLAAPHIHAGITKVAGIEARGFILGAAVAHHLGAGFVPLRKKGKLPHDTLSCSYSLEYGVEEIEIHRDAVSVGEHVLLLDDLIATGGTAMAALTLLRQVGAQVRAACFVIDLPDLGGAALLRAQGICVQTLVAFPGH